MRASSNKLEAQGAAGRVKWSRQSGGSEDRPRSRSGSGFLFPRLGPCERFSRCRLHTPTVLPRPCSLTLAAAACSLRVPRRGWLPTAAHVQPDLNSRRPLSRALSRPSPLAIRYQLSDAARRSLEQPSWVAASPFEGSTRSARCVYSSPSCASRLQTTAVRMAITAEG